MQTASPVSCPCPPGRGHCFKSLQKPIAMPFAHEAQWAKTYFRMTRAHRNAVAASAHAGVQCVVRRLGGRGRAPGQSDFCKKPKGVHGQPSRSGFPQHPPPYREVDCLSRQIGQQRTAGRLCRHNRGRGRHGDRVRRPVPRADQVRSREQRQLRPARREYLQPAPLYCSVFRSVVRKAVVEHGKRFR